MSQIYCFQLVTVKPETETKVMMMKEIKEEEDEEEDFVPTSEDVEDHEAEAVPGTNKKVKVLKTTQSLPTAKTGTDPDNAEQKMSRQNSLPHQVSVL